MGQTIFDELKLLEYYKDLESHDESIKSIFLKLPRPVLKEDEQSEPSIKISFLKDWDKKWATSHAESLVSDGDTKEITKTKFLDLFFDYYKDKRESFKELKIQDNKNVLKTAENHWNIRQGVSNDWGSTFNKLLSLYNTQDFRTVINTFTTNKHHLHRKDNRISVEELERWFYPKVNPPYWKKIFKPTAYKQEKQINQKDIERLPRALKPNESNVKVTQEEFIDGIMTELRKGEIMVEIELERIFVVLLNLVLIYR